MIRILLFVLVLTLPAASVRAQIFGGEGASMTAPGKTSVKWTHMAAPVDGGYQLRIVGAIPKGLHVFSLKPSEKPANLPTELRFDEKSTAKAKGEAKEAGNIIREYDKIFETEIAYFKKDVTFMQSLTGKKGDLVKGALHYQVCDEEGRCTAESYPFEVRLP